MATTVKRRTTKVKNTAPAKRRRTAISPRKTKQPSKIVNTLVPFIFIVAILFCLGFLLVMGIRTVAASSFFDVRRIEVKGLSKVSKDDVEKIVHNHSDRNGVWNSELEGIKNDVQKLAFAKEVVVSRILPDGIQVQVNERVPKAVIRLNGNDFWVDDEGAIVASVGKNEPRPSAVLRGWDEAKTEKAQKDNQERVKLYSKIREELQGVGIDKRISLIDLGDLQDAQIGIGDSGETILVSLGKEDFAKRLQIALTVIEGKGQTIESIKSYGGNPIATYRNS